MQKEMEAIVLLLCLLTLWGIKFAQPHSFNLGFISKETCSSLKGFFALVVILHHYALKYPNEGIICRVFSYLGFLAVSIFFFISGFGLTKNYTSSGKQLYIGRYFVKIGIPFLVFNLLYCCVALCEKHPYTLGYAAYSYLKYGQPIIDFGWYIVVYILLIVVFSLCSLLKPTSGIMQIVCSLLFCIAWIIFCKWKDWGSWWYVSNFAFVLGLFFGYKEKPIVKLCKRYYSKILTCTAVAFCVLFYLVCNIEMDEIIHIACSIAFPVLVFLVSGKIIIKNYIYNFLGEMSLELYLVHGIFLNHVSLYNNSIINCLSVILLSACSAFLLHYFFKSVNSKLLPSK